jgi:hypothetical protein
LVTRWGEILYPSNPVVTYPTLEEAYLWLRQELGDEDVRHR